MTTEELLIVLRDGSSDNKRIAMAALALRFGGRKPVRDEVHFEAPVAPQYAERDRSDAPDWSLLPVPQRVTPVEFTRRVVSGMPIEIAVPFFTPSSGE
jgi:hypothetical protein